MITGFRYFAILGAMRTGSNLLERSLVQYDRITCHGELFNPAFMGKAGRDQAFGITMDQRERNPVNLLRAMWAEDPDKLTGFRYFEGHDPRIMDLVISDATCAKIVLTRDALDSYVSLKIARATDQWMLRNVNSRKVAKIRFDMAEYEAFLADRSRFYSDVRTRLQASGQAAFEICFDDLRSKEAINGLAAYLGADQVLDDIEEPIKRQNPEPLSAKVENHDEMQALLASNAADMRHQSQHMPQPGAARVKSFVVSNNKPLLFAPIPGYPAPHVAAWMSGLGGVSSKLTRGDLSDWLERNPDVTSFSIVEHPVARAYRALTDRIQSNGPDSFPNIRARLAAHYGVPSRDEDAVLSPEEQASAFLAFLDFLKSNLAGQTGIRVDGSWQAQDDHIGRITELQPLTRIVRAENLPLSGEFSDLHAAAVSGPVPLGEIYNAEIERKARQVYARDYRKFGYRDWSAYAA